MELTQEELAAEQAAAQTPKEDDVRSRIIEEFGFDESVDSEKIDKLVKRDIENHKKLSQAIGQKIAYRKKAEDLEKNPPKQEEGQLSPKDFLALQEAQVKADDFDEVLRVSKILGKSVNESLKDKTLQTILATRVEERNTAAATQIGKQRGSSQVSGDALIEAAEKGQVPDSDADIEKMVEARLQAKTKR